MSVRRALIRKLIEFKPPVLICRSMSTSINHDYKNIVVDRAGGIMTIGINRPEKRNAVNPETARELTAAFNQFENDPESLSAVLYGKGGNFCGGFDLSFLATGDVDTLQKQHEDGLGPMGPSRMCFNKPVIAAIDGYAVAGGFELAMMCDLRVVEESAIMGVYCRRFGVPLIDGGTVRLQKLIGLSRALDIILTGRSVTAKEAVDIGLANRMTATGSALSEAIQLAYSLQKFPQQCMNADKRSAYYAAYKATSQEDALLYEFLNGVKVVQDESIPGAQRFKSGIGRKGSFNLNAPVKPKL